MSDGRDIGYAVVGCGFGIFSFFKGFKVLQKKRLIQDIPTSTIRGLAMGLVELNGKAKKVKILQSPLTGKNCVYYQYIIERYESSGKSSHWVTVSKGDSSYCPFCIDDGTGSVVVFPQGAELILPVDYEFQTGLGRTLPDSVNDFMGQHGISYRGFLGGYTMRFRESYITPDESVFILGTAKKNEGHLDIHFEKVAERIDELKQSTQEPLQSKIPLSQQGQISDQEWAQAVKMTEGGLLEKEIQADAKSELLDTEVIIGQGDNGQIFIISDESQTQVIQNFSWQSFAHIWGGAFLSLATLAYLLFRLGIWARF